jgi:hypothetical protein
MKQKTDGSMLTGLCAPARNPARDFHLREKAAGRRSISRFISISPASEQRSVRTGPRWWRNLQWKIFFAGFIFSSAVGDHHSIPHFGLALDLSDLKFEFF